MTNRLAGWAETYFYAFMSLLITVVVGCGFSRTVDKNLIHPATPRPLLLYIHATVFTGWVLFYIFQCALVRTRSVRLHRKIGWFGVALGVLIPVLGITTAITMARFNVAHFHVLHAESDLIVSFFDMIAFMVAFTLAIHWRKQPEYHRRLLLIASCGLTAAAFGRFPPRLLPPTLFYAGVDALILLGLARDLILSRRIHQVYQYGFPALILGQATVMYINIHGSPYWSSVARAILG